jgi:YHS domain-containing protein
MKPGEIMQTLMSLMLFLTLSLPALAQDGRNTAKYNLSASVGLKGYDPVAVFPEGGGEAQIGSGAFSLIHEGVIYNFANAANLQRFQQNPLKYEPTYGGWCAFAMAYGSHVDIVPQFFTIHGRRAHYFVNSRAKRNFDADIRGHEQRADANWKNISGESARQ